MTTSIDVSTLPRRTGDRPDTHNQMPHQQVSQNAPSEMQESLFERIAALPGVVIGQSHVSVPGARAFHLDPGLAAEDSSAFMVGTEFAHLHPSYDGSLHIVLPEAAARQVIELGWGEFHPLVSQGLMPPTNVMIFGPRDAAELDIIWAIVRVSYDAARRDSAAE